MRWWSIIRTDLSRSRRRFAVVTSAVAGCVALALVLLALGSGLYSGLVRPLLPRLPLTLLKVEPRSVSLGLLAFDASALTGGFDSSALDRIRRIEGVEAVYPVAAAAFPMRAEGGEGFLGRRLYTDVFATGVDPSLVAADVAPSFAFEVPKSTDQPVPVLVARRLLDLYNSTVAGAIQKPRLSPEAVIGFQFELVLGSSYARGTPDPSKVERRVAQIVGLSEHATLVGITVPEALLRQWNAARGHSDSPLSGAWVRTRDPADAARVSRAIEGAGLKVDETTKMIGTALSIGGALIGAVLLLILLLVSFAIAQSFFLLVGERRLELATLRALGARPNDLRRLILMEAALAGTFGALAGMGLGSATSVGVEAVVLANLPDLPFRPDHLVALSAWVLASAAGLGVLASLLGALLPAARAAAADPAIALRT